MGQINNIQRKLRSRSPTRPNNDPTGSWLVKIPSLHRSHRTPLQRSSPRGLAKTITRDETSMSTIVLANYSSTEYAAVLSFFLYSFSYLDISISLLKKVRRDSLLLLKNNIIIITYSKTPPFPDHNSSWSFYLHNSYHSIWYSWVTSSPLCTFLSKLKHMV